MFWKKNMYIICVQKETNDKKNKGKNNKKSKKKYVRG